MLLRVALNNILIIKFHRYNSLVRVNSCVTILVGKTRSLIKLKKYRINFYYMEDLTSFIFRRKVNRCA